jgi:hypothetical protein
MDDALDLGRLQARTFHQTREYRHPDLYRGLLWRCVQWSDSSPSSAFSLLLVRLSLIFLMVSLLNAGCSLFNLFLISYSQIMMLFRV